MLLLFLMRALVLSLKQPPSLTHPYAPTTIVTATVGAVGEHKWQGHGLGLPHSIQHWNPVVKSITIAEGLGLGCSWGCR